MANEKSTPRNTITVYGDGSTPYIVKGNDDYIKVNTSGGAISIFVPNILGSGLNNSVKRFYIADASGTAAANKITLYPIGGNLMNGAASLVLDVNNVTAELLIVNNNEWQVNLSGDSGATPVVAFGSITGTPSNQTNLQDGTIQGGTFTPANIAVALGNSFRTAFERLQGQITALIASFIPFVSTNYVAVKATGIGTVNGAALIAAVTAAQALTPNGVALSATNRAVVYLFAGVYNLGSSFFSLGQFVDLIILGDSKDVIITSTNSTGTIQIANTNDYAIKNCTINNTGTGGSITHNAGQTDNGIWENLILGAYNTEGTIFTGTYSKLTATSNNVLNGNISGTVKDSSFLNYSCGYSSAGSVTISGTINNCVGTIGCFGLGFTGVTISGIIKDSTSTTLSFGHASTGICLISGTLNNCKGTINGSGYSNNDTVISGTIKGCEGSEKCFGFGGSSVDIQSTARIINCIGADNCFGSSNGTATMDGYITECKALTLSFGYGDGAVTFGGTILNCIGTIGCFAVSATSVSFTGIIENSKGGNSCFGYGNTSSPVTLTSTSRIFNCTASINSFGYSQTGNVIIAGSIVDSVATTTSFGSSAGIIDIQSTARIINCTGTSDCFGYSSGSTVAISGTMQDCSATTNSFGDTASTGKLISCTRTQGYGTHAGKIYSCSFSENHAINPALTVATGAIVKYSTIYQAGAGECIDGANGTVASIYQNAMNKIENVVNVTNNIVTPYNVVDTNVII